jgi:hypothetical protein
MSRSANIVNRSNQKNPNNNAYWESRGYEARPDDWRVASMAGAGAFNSTSASRRKLRGTIQLSRPNRNKARSK